MAKKNPIGFIWPKEDEEEQKAEATIGDVEKEFVRIISELEIDENLTKKHLAIDKKVRKELIKLFRKIREIEVKVKRRVNLLNQCNAYQRDYPEKSLELLHQIDELDYELMPEIEKLSKEISEHCLPDVADIYKTLELSAEDVKHVRTLAMTMSSKFGSIVGDIHSAISNQQTEMMRRQILSAHPDLSK